MASLSRFLGEGATPGNQEKGLRAQDITVFTVEYVMSVCRSQNNTYYMKMESE